MPLIVIAGRDYGAGSSRDWAAKGTRLLGARAGRRDPVLEQLTGEGREAIDGA